MDDAPEVRRMLSLMLQNEGYEILEADCGNEAVEILLSNSVDLIISDIDMPNGDGLYLLRISQSQSNPPPVILISGGHLISREGVKALGAVAFFEKPFRIEEFLVVVRRVLVPYF